MILWHAKNFYFESCPEVNVTWYIKCTEIGQWAVCGDLWPLQSSETLTFDLRDSRSTDDQLSCYIYVNITCYCNVNGLTPPSVGPHRLH